MNLQQFLNSITPEIYRNLKEAVEIRKWPDGNRLSTEQLQLCMQAVIAYEQKNLPPEEHSGYIPPEPHSYCGDDHEHDHQEEKSIKWVE